MKYTAPSYELVKAEVQDVITASITDNGKSSYEANGKTYEGQKGTFSSWFSEIF